jgi:ubiquinol-cytochrome c reductase cytochrome b/c1 subunit
MNWLSKNTDKFLDWFEYRLPVRSFMKHQGEYQTPRNLSYAWNFGSLAGVALMIQIVTGIFLAMNYVPHVDHAFDSVERIMRDVPFGWLLRYTHAVGASMFFGVVYLHIFRGFYYGSYKKPREVLWWFGVIIFLTMMGTAFMGYVLPWGQMSFWGATVITGLFTAFDEVIAGLGTGIQELLLGSFSVDNPTLNRFFSLHYLLPFVIFGLVAVHVIALHVHGSSNPTGVDVKTKKDTIPFHPYYTIKDFFGFGVFFIIFAGFLFFGPNYLGHPDNYIPANPLVTPPHIVPEWYFLPYYAILRVVPDLGIPFTDIVIIKSKLAGVIAMFGSILIWFVVPWLDKHPVRSGAYRPIFKLFYAVFVVSFVILGYVGSQPADGVVFGIPLLYIGRLFAIYYFAYFLVVLPVLSKKEKAKELPDSIYEYTKKKYGNKIVSVLVLVLVSFSSSGAIASGGEEIHYKQVKWGFDGVTGKLDQQSAQRGFQVYKEVCAACHGLKRVAFRNLQEIGLSEQEVKVLASQYTFTDGPNESGDMYERPGRPSDRLPSPYPNAQAGAAANGGATPPDLSLITKARHDGANYLYSLLTGYAAEVPAGVTIPDGKHYNKYFPGHAISMPKPISDGQVTYIDGTEATAEQMSKDVVNFLQWAAEPEMQARKQTGVKAIIFLLVFTAFFYIAKKRIWAKIGQ